ncbi:hypothetical protein ACFE04_004092 [Oxalis oulophora]
MITTTVISADDAAVMAKLQEALSPPGWFTTTQFCKWQGITCDNSETYVIIIKADNLHLTGDLPVELGLLTNLKTLSLQQNSLTGSIPSLANISTLESIYLNNNNFTSIQTGCFTGLTSLQTLSLSYNQFLNPWPFPTQLTDSSALTKLYLDHVNLFDTIPDIFASFHSLQELQLSYNNLTGSIPPSFAASSIQRLLLNNQQGACLSGTIDVLASMTLLNQAWLQSNHFTGPIPDFSNCTDLFDLQLRDNLFTGIVPATLVNLSSLQNISFSNNDLQGPKPQFPSHVNVLTNGRNSFCTTDGSPCDPQVTTMMEIARGFGYPLLLSTSWKDNDACSGWSFVTCDGKNNVMTVNLANKNLSGIISPAFGNLTKLRTLLLNDNHLTGSIPDSLTKLTDLATVDVSNNDLSGKVPAFASTVKLTDSGNPSIGKDIVPGSPPGDSPSDDGGSSHRIFVIIGVVIAVLIFLSVMAFVLYTYVIKKKYTKIGRVETPEIKKVVIDKNVVNSGAQSELQSPSIADSNDQHLFEGGNGAISIHVLQQVTNNFSEDNILGRGGFGVVYKGVLHDSTQIAVKRMESSMMGTKGMGEFQAEIAVLTKVRHRHLVGLLGYCVNGYERMLVYEYMPQGTLGQHLFEWRELATGRVTTKVDIFAFGVVLMEIITGRKALDENLPDEQCHLVTWFRRILTNRELILKNIDETLNTNEDTISSIFKVAELAGHCTARESYQRPDMGHAVNVLGPLIQEWKPSNQRDEDDYGIDLHNMSLPEALERWQAEEDTSTIFQGDMLSFSHSHSQSQSSIPSKPSEFQDTMRSGR